MNYSLEITDKAMDCLVEATTWYAEKHDWSESRFQYELDRTFSLILHNPMQFPAWSPPLRKALIRKFRYMVIYEVDGDLIIIYQIFNTRQDPKKIVQPN